MTDSYISQPILNCWASLVQCNTIQDRQIQMHTNYNLGDNEGTSDDKSESEATHQG